MCSENTARIIQSYWLNWIIVHFTFCGHTFVSWPTVAWLLSMVEVGWMKMYFHAARSCAVHGRHFSQKSTNRTDANYGWSCVAAAAVRVQKAREKKSPRRTNCVRVGSSETCGLWALCEWVCQKYYNFYFHKNIFDASRLQSTCFKQWRWSFTHAIRIHFLCRRLFVRWLSRRPLSMISLSLLLSEPLPTFKRFSVTR